MVFLRDDSQVSQPEWFANTTFHGEVRSALQAICNVYHDEDDPNNLTGRYAEVMSVDEKITIILNENIGGLPYLEVRSLDHYNVTYRQTLPLSGGASNTFEYLFNILKPNTIESLNDIDNFPIYF